MSELSEDLQKLKAKLAEFTPEEKEVEFVKKSIERAERLLSRLE